MLCEYANKIKFHHFSPELETYTAAVAETYVHKISQGLIIHFPKDRLIELFHRVLNPIVLLTSNPYNNTLCYYHSLLVFFYHHLWDGNDSVVLNRAMDIVHVAKKLREKAADILRPAVYNRVQKAEKAIRRYHDTRVLEEEKRRLEQVYLMWKRNWVSHHWRRQ
ncbi:hypothetical protein FACS189472_15440 [Alphaproteobacteria bacterium]|nr:hypothetical protein FACS189472_15440 [Alphaproteobacteria bacterium]